MIAITYGELVLAITVLWIAVRCCVRFLQGNGSVKRELELLLVYICIVVVARFTFFPFGRVAGGMQLLLFDKSKLFPLRINWKPFVFLFDYVLLREALLNLVGNIAMFIPLGIVWPSVFRKLNTPGKTVFAGAGFSLLIELLQLPFYDRVSDIDDLLLNTLGFVLGYGLYRLFRKKNAYGYRHPK